MKKCCTISVGTEKSLSLKHLQERLRGKSQFRTTDMSLLVWATGGVQWVSGLPFSRVCFNSTWDFNSASCFNLHRTILRGFLIKSSSGLFLTLQQNTSLWQKKKQCKIQCSFYIRRIMYLHMLYIYGLNCHCHNQHYLSKRMIWKAWQTPTNTSLLPRSHNATLILHAWQLFLLKTDKVQPAPALSVSHHWNWGCLVVSVLYI